MTETLCLVVSAEENSKFVFFGQSKEDLFQQVYDEDRYYFSEYEDPSDVKLFRVSSISSVEQELAEFLKLKYKEAVEQEKKRVRAVQLKNLANSKDEYSEIGYAKRLAEINRNYPER